MGLTDMTEQEDELLQLLLAAETEELATEATASVQVATPQPAPATPTASASLRDSSAFATDLANGTKEEENGGASTSTGTPKRTNGFSAALNRSAAKDADGKGTKSIIASTTDALDSSDDEDVSNFLQRKYNEYGRDISTMLKKKSDESHEERVARDVDRNLRLTPKPRGVQPTPHAFPAYNGPAAARSTASTTSSAAAAAKPAPIPISRDIGVYTDPIFGLRIVHPLISSTAMQERMLGRTAVTISSLAAHIAHGDKSKDWAMAGVIVAKGNMMTSKKGSQYAIWKVSDLRQPDLRQVSVFLFKQACKDLWKTAQGMVVAILNPGVMDNDKMGEVSLSLDSTQKCMMLGQSKDLGTCRAKKKNGDPCTSIVNKYTCEYCVFHVKQEYGKMAGRVELQSATSGRGLEALRNKVLGKNEVFYGGQSFSAIPAKKSAKLVAKDQERMMTLSQYYQSPNAGGSGGGATTVTTSTPNRLAAKALPTSRIASTIEANQQQRLRDLERLQKLEAENERFKKLAAEKAGTSTKAAAVSSAIAAKTIAAVPEKFRAMEFSAQAKPSLKREGFSFDIDGGGGGVGGLGTAAISQRQAAANKAKALAVLRKTPIAAANPNLVRHRGTEQARKRVAEELAARDPAQVKRQKITEEAERFQKERIAAIINAKSAHADLVEQKQRDDQAEYFERLEKKEAMEEKMLGTFSMPCKAVTCAKCKYTAFSAADRCKKERHPIRVIDAEKRFFECADCGSRTATVHRMPQMTCKNCQGSKWRRAAMIKERTAEGAGEKLSIRGDEETFIGGMVTGGSLNLCVAAED